MEEVDPPPPPGVDESGGTELHPLENPVVLERLFELIPFRLEDFKKIRLVSRAWHNVSLSTWRKNVWLILQDSDEDERGGTENVEDDNEKEIDRISRHKYLDLVENEQLQLIQHPFRKYSLNGWFIKLRSLNQDGEQDQLRFWNRVGPLMNHLKLSESEFAGVADFRTVIFEATSNLQSLKLTQTFYNGERPAKKEQRLDLKLPQHAVIPTEQVQNNLMELEIDLVRTLVFDGEGDDARPIFSASFLPITWIELIIHFPNIKKLGPLELGATAEAELLELFESTEILKKERGPRYLAQLSDLDLTSEVAFGGTLISSINRLHFPLKRLTFAIDSTVDEETFKQLLQHPLEFLHVVREHDGDTMPFQNFPFGLEFMALKELEMSGPIAPNLVFLRECPKLEKFSYNPGEGREADLTAGLNDGDLTKLEKLKNLSIDNYLCSAEQIRKLGELMPNMKTLRTGLDDGGFRAVCEVWKELEHLTISPWQIGEEALLGKDERGVKFRHPNLTDLKNLKEFDTLYQRNRQGFTDAMILDGLLALPNLETVNRIWVSSQISPLVVAAAEFQQNLQNNGAADSR